MKSYASPFADRYSSEEMLHLFSPDKKFRTWRALWIALAEEERKLGLSRITPEAIADMKRHAEEIDYEAARRHEERLKHDVMAHIRAWEEQCPKAKGIIHLGATSMYVVDNADLIILREAFELVRRELINIVKALSGVARRYASEPTVAFTHFQPAQFTTVGKRACLWIQDLLLDIEEVDTRLARLRFLGVKGATGTQATFLNLFDGNEDKVRQLDDRVARAMGFRSTWRACGQTYTRKVDAQASAALAGIAESAHKFANDLRLLQNLREIQEPFEEEQVGSSAMAYKRNPMKSERMTSLSRLVLVLSQDAAFTAANQWFERTLDDSAGKRIAIPEAFLAVDAILRLYYDISSRLVVNRDVIRSNVERELPFIATENILMEAVKAGGDRQELHERIRVHSRGVAENLKNGKGNDLLERLKKDGAFKSIRTRLSGLMVPKAYVGRSPSQVREFLESEVDPVLKKHRGLLGWKVSVKV